MCNHKRLQAVNQLEQEQNWGITLPDLNSYYYKATIIKRVCVKIDRLMEDLRAQK